VLGKGHQEGYPDLRADALKGAARLGLAASFRQHAFDPRAFFGGILAFLGEDWSEDCLAPLGRKINSSNVEDEREKVREAVRNNDLYRKAEDLYRQVFEWTGEETDEAALDELRPSPLRNATGRRLIG